nr:TLC domain-containing protein 5-like isoform X3 [Zootoca vivipara]
MCLSLGYFLFDLSWCIYFKSEGHLMLSHHMLSVSGLAFVLMIGKSATEINAIVFVSEITNPLLQLRWFLREMGRYHNLLGDVVDYLFVSLFLGLRIAGGAWIVQSVVTSLNTIWMLKGGVLAMYMVSWAFMLDIISFARRKATKKYFAWKNEKMKGKHPKENGHLPKC